MATRIDRNNYEVYFLDAIEGNLAPQLEPFLHEFLLSNQDLALEFEQMREVMSSSIKESEVHTFPFKSTLIKPALPDSQDEINRLLIDEVEHNLIPGDRDRIEKWTLIYPDVAKSRQLFSATILPAHNQNFEEKNALYFNETPDFSDTQTLLAAAAENDIGIHELKQKGVDPDKNPLHRQAISILKQVRLQAGQEIFEGKGSLRKREALVISFRTIALSFTAAAAIVILLFTVIQNDSTHHARIAAFADAFPPIKLMPLAENKINSSSGYPEPQRTVTHKTTPTSKSNSNERLVLTNADVTEESYTAQSGSRIPIHIVRITPISHGAIAMFDESRLLLPEPDMRLVHQSIAQPDTPEGENRTVNLFEYLSKSAAERIENSYAYSFTSKQYARIAERKAEYFKIEKNPDNEKTTIRLAGIEVERGKRLSDKKENGLIQRAERLYKRISKD
jgi:hypothetical protein